MKVLKTAVVGLGRIGWNKHIPEIIKHHEKFSLTAVVDVSRERLAEAKEVYGVNGYTDIAQMMAAEKPDLVVIASPTHLHYDHACTAMQLGADVFLDKPMAPDYETACAIAKCAEETGRKLMVYQPIRAKAETNQLMQIIHSGKIGKLMSIHLSRTNYSRRSDWQTFKKYGGGMLNNYGAHYIDLLIYMTQEKISRLFCSTDIVASVGDADDVARIILRTQNGITLDIDINQAAALGGPSWLVYGQYGAIIREVSPEDNKPQFRVRWYNPEDMPQITASEDLAAANRSYNHDVPIPWNTEVIPVDSSFAIDFYEKVYEYFAECKAPYVPIEDTLYVMELIKRCHIDSAQ